MTKSSIINEVAKVLNTTTTEAPIVEAIFETLKTTLESGEDVNISDFGKFVIRAKAARIGRNPITGEEAEILARKVVTFKPSWVFREAVGKK